MNQQEKRLLLSLMHLILERLCLQEMLQRLSTLQHTLGDLQISSQATRYFSSTTLGSCSKRYAKALLLLILQYFICFRFVRFYVQKTQVLLDVHCITVVLIFRSKMFFVQMTWNDQIERTTVMLELLTVVFFLFHWHIIEQRSNTNFTLRKFYFQPPSAILFLATQCHRMEQNFNFSMTWNYLQIRFCFKSLVDLMIFFYSLFFLCSVSNQYHIFFLSATAFFWLVLTGLSPLDYL